MESRPKKQSYYARALRVVWADLRTFIHFWLPIVVLWALGALLFVAYDQRWIHAAKLEFVVNSVLVVLGWALVENIAYAKKRYMKGMESILELHDCMAEWLRMYMLGVDSGRLKNHSNLVYIMCARMTEAVIYFQQTSWETFVGVQNAIEKDMPDRHGQIRFLEWGDSSVKSIRVVVDQNTVFHAKSIDEYMYILSKYSNEWEQPEKSDPVMRWGNPAEGNNIPFLRMNIVTVLTRLCALDKIDLPAVITVYLTFTTWVMILLFTMQLWLLFGWYGTLAYVFLSTAFYWMYHVGFALHDPMQDLRSGMFVESKVHEHIRDHIKKLKSLYWFEATNPTQFEMQQKLMVSPALGGGAQPTGIRVGEKYPWERMPQRR